MKNLNLKYKLFLTLTVIVLFYAACSVMLVNLYLRGTLRTYLINEGKGLVSIVSSHVTDDVLISNLLKIDEYFKSVMQNNTFVSYIFIEKSGNVLIHTFHDGFPKGLLNTKHKKDTVNYVVVETADDNYYDFSAPLFDGKAGILRLGMSGKTIDTVIGKISNSMLYVALATLVVALCVSMLLSRRLTTPLSMLASSALEIAKGDYSKDVRTESNDEVGKLSGAFHEMAVAVRMREQQLREINEELETVNVTLHEKMEELHRTKDELIKIQQDRAVVATKEAFLHHLRQPLTYLILTIDLFTEEMKKGLVKSNEESLKRLETIEYAGIQVEELLKKFEKLNEYKTVEYSSRTKIIDIEE